MRLQSIEWTKNLPIASFPCATHFVLPDLPRLYPPEAREKFFATVPAQQQILTIATASHSKQTFLDTLQRHQQNGIQNFLIVGGNRKNKYTLSSTKAIECAKTSSSSSSSNHVFNIWCVADPNDKSSPAGLRDKRNAGADGVITQPLLSSYALETMRTSYPSSSQDSPFHLVPGLALPKNESDLLFWLTLLLNQMEVKDDELFQSHVQYFREGGSPLEWARNQRGLLEQFHGVHYMPVRNIKGLLDLQNASS